MQNAIVLTIQTEQSRYLESVHVLLVATIINESLRCYHLHRFLLSRWCHLAGGRQICDGNCDLSLWCLGQRIEPASTLESVSDSCYDL